MQRQQVIVKMNDDKNGNGEDLSDISVDDDKKEADCDDENLILLAI